MERSIGQAGPVDVGHAPVCAYGQRFKTEGDDLQRVILVYPWHEGIAPGLMEEQGLISSDGVKVDLFFVDLACIEESIKSLTEVIAAIS